MKSGEDRERDVPEDDDLGFNPYGCGPVPIRLRLPDDDQRKAQQDDDSAV
jgi:hypothetical protein